MATADLEAEARKAAAASEMEGTGTPAVQLESQNGFSGTPELICMEAIMASMGFFEYEGPEDSRRVSSAGTLSGCAEDLRLR